MSQFNTTPLSYTGSEFSTEEKAQFRVDWELMGKDFSNATGTLADGNLSSNVALRSAINTVGNLSNVAYLNQANPFTAKQTINAGTGGLHVIGNQTDVQIKLERSGSGAITSYIGAGGDYLFNLYNDGFNPKFTVDKTGLTNSVGGYQVAGVTRIDASGNYTGGSGSFGNFISMNYPTDARFVMGQTNSVAKWLVGSHKNVGGDDNNLALYSYLGSVMSFYAGSKKLETTSTGIAVTGNAVVSGTVTAPTINATTGIQTAGVTRIDASGNYTGGSGSFSGELNLGISTTSPLRIVSANSYIYIQSTKSSTVDSFKDFIFTGRNGNFEKFRITKNGTSTTGGSVVSGTVTASGGYLPFTGCHIARSDKDLKIGELVKIESKGWINEKQPDWVADYCNGSYQGVYGIVYNIIDEDVMEDYTEIESKPVMITEKYTEREIQLIDGEYQIVEVEKEREVQAYDEFPIKDSEEMHKVPRMEDVEVTKQRKVGSIKKYHIAATGDGFCYTDCPVEYGDYLIPSTTEGLVTVYKGSDVPKNFVGIAGETKTESGKIAWTKE